VFIVIHQPDGIVKLHKSLCSNTPNSINASQAVTHFILSIYLLRVHNIDTHVLHQILTFSSVVRFIL